MTANNQSSLLISDEIATSSTLPPSALINMEEHAKKAKAHLKEYANRYLVELPLRTKMRQSGYSSEVPYPAGMEADRRQTVPRFAPSMYSRLLRELSFLYSASPRRTVPDEFVGFFADYLYRVGVGINSAMSTADQFSRSDGMALIVPLWAETLTLLGVLLEVIPADRFVPVMGLDPLIPEAVFYTSEAVTDTAQDKKGRTWKYLSSNLNGIIEEQNVSEGTNGVLSESISWVLIEAVPNPLGMTQAVLVREDAAAQPRNKPWAQGLGGTDILSSIIASARSWNELARVTELQRGQPVATAEIEAGTILSPETPIIVKNGDFKFEKNNADLTGMIESIITQQRSIASSGGADPSVLEVRSSAAVESGKALQIKEHSRTKDRFDRVNFFGAVEAAIHVIASSFGKANGKLSRKLLASEFSIAYTFPEPPLTVQEVLLRQAHEFAHDMLTRETAKQELHPNLSLDEIRLELSAADGEKGSTNVSDDDVIGNTTSSDDGTEGSGSADASGDASQEDRTGFSGDASQGGNAE